MELKILSRLRFLDIISRYSQGLIYEWTLNRTLIDRVQCIPLTAKGKITYIQETSNYSSVSIVNGSYLQAPPGYYFNQPFSISAWVYILNQTYSARVLDFANGAPNQNVFLAYSIGNTNNFFLKVYYGNISTQYKGVLNPSSPVLGTNYWFHIAATLHPNNTACLYYNGSLVTQSVWTNESINFWRTKNYIGKSNFNGSDGPTFAKFRNVRIYNKALDSSQIQNDMFN